MRATVASASCRGAEQQVAVAALESGFLAHGDMGAGERLAAGGGGEVFQPVGQRARMGAAADAFAMGVEQHDLDLRQAVLGEEFGDLHAQAFDQVAGGKLADIAAGIGVAELQAEFAGGAQIGAPMRAAQGPRR